MSMCAGCVCVCVGGGGGTGDGVTHGCWAVDIRGVGSGVGVGV